MKPLRKSLRWDHVAVDSQVQRHLDRSWVTRTLEEEGYRPEAVGVPAVSLRADGTLHMIDGQHRRALALESGRGMDEVDCQVYEGFTKAQEAAMFRLLNHRRAVGILDKFLIRIVEGDPTAVALNEALQAHGWTVNTGKADGRFAAVGALEKIYKGGGFREPGQRYIVDLTIEMITEAWGHNPTGVRSEIVSGLGMVLLRHEIELDLPKVVTEMTVHEGGALGVVSRAKLLQRLRGGRLSDAAAEIIVAMHNKSKRSKRLPDWRDATV